MTFDGGKIEDTSTTRQHVSIQNIVASEKGELVMAAKGRIVLWRYSNLVFSNILLFGKFIIDLNQRNREMYNILLALN